MTGLAQRLRAVTGERRPTLPDLARRLGDLGLTSEEVDPLVKADPSRPYGRHVFLSSPEVEGMLATWTPGMACAPHDHGGASGAVRVLRGICLHHTWALRSGGLVLERTEAHGPGEVLVCEPDLIHSMADGGGESPLVTLHVYLGTIEHMLVYDVPGYRTLAVEGDFGAWVPDDHRLVRWQRPGFLQDVAVRVA